RVVDLLEDGLQGRPVEPDGVRQVGSPNLALALAVLAVTAGAILGKALRPGRDIGALRPVETGQRADIARDVGDLFRLEDAVPAKRGHLALPAVGIVVAHPV